MERRLYEEGNRDGDLLWVKGAGRCVGVPKKRKRRVRLEMVGASLGPAEGIGLWRVWVVYLGDPS